MEFDGKKEIVRQVQRFLGFDVDDVDGVDGSKTWNAILSKIKSVTPEPVIEVPVVDELSFTLSPRALKLILDYEVGGGEAYYNRFLKYPTWPGASSGVTIGIGYDLGYNTTDQFTKDWSNLLPADAFTRLRTRLTTKGSAASSLVRSVKDISIPWEAALQVFQSNTIPRFVKETLRAFPKADQLHPDAFGALVSIVFNRGSSTTGDSRKEMYNIKALVLAKDYHGIAREVRSMKRLWVGKGLDGLLKRRDEEALLIESCA